MQNYILGLKTTLEEISYDLQLEEGYRIFDWIQVISLKKITLIESISTANISDNLLNLCCFLIDSFLYFATI